MNTVVVVVQRAAVVAPSPDSGGRVEVVSNCCYWGPSVKPLPSLIIMMASLSPGEIHKCSQEDTVQENIPCLEGNVEVNKQMHEEAL